MAKQYDLPENGGYDEIRRRIERRYRRHAAVLVNVVSFALFTAYIQQRSALGLLPDWGVTVGGVVWIVWLLAVIAHLLLHLVYLTQERAIQKEIERERAWQLEMRKYSYQQMDTERRARLSDDGEVVYLDDDGTQPKRKREL